MGQKESSARVSTPRLSHVISRTGGPLLFRLPVAWPCCLEETLEIGVTAVAHSATCVGTNRCTLGYIHTVAVWLNDVFISPHYNSQHLARQWDLCSYTCLQKNRPWTENTKQTLILKWLNKFFVMKSILIWRPHHTGRNSLSNWSKTTYMTGGNIVL